jgi:hypothetical protein
MLRRSTLALAIFFATFSFASAKSDLAPGNYILYYAPAAASEQGLFLIKVEHKGGKDVVEVLDPSDGATVDSAAIENRKVLIRFKAFGRDLSFDGTISEKDPKSIVGSFGDDQLITRSRLTPTENEKMQQADRFKAVKLPESMTKAMQLGAKVPQLNFKLRQAKDDESRAEVKKQIEEAKKEADEKVPGLYAEVLEKHADSPAVVDAALALLGRAEKSAKPADAAKWLKAAETFAAPYGARYQLEIASKCVSALANQKGFENVALEAAARMEQAINETTTVGQQSRVLKALHAAQEKAGKTDLAKQTELRIAKIETALDKEYLAKVPPFKPKSFEGRKGKSDRVVVFELFTGAQCPPCVAADVAFDALEKTYKPKDLILLQYHMHIPGPDPLTNPDSEARWKFYGNLRGTPSSLFNGKVNPGGGGGMAQAEGKFKSYQGVIDPLLEETSPIKLSGGIATKGDKLSIKVDVDGIKEGGESLKLRFVLVEESIRYTGGNGLRFHHHVVRAFPGGVAGMELKDKSATKTADVDLAELRKNLTKYLDDHAKESPFPNADRPLALKNLRVVAFVQDDGSKEILQAIQLESAAD